MGRLSIGAYRAGMVALPLATPPSIEANARADRLELAANLSLGDVREFAEASIWRVGLSAIVEDRSGAIAYWALAHEPGKPDFHHSDARTLALTAEAS